jgi:PAS domain S-box-containing protein
MRNEKSNAGETSPDVPSGEYALHVLEQRNEAFRVLYDTVVDVENADEMQVYDVLCRNLKRLCQADGAAIASYTSETREVVLRAIEFDRVDRSRPSEEFSARCVLAERDVANLHQFQLLPCSPEDGCLTELLPKSVREHIQRNEQGRCQRMSCIRGGSLLALGLVYHADGRELQNTDLLNTCLSLAGVVLQRIKATQELRYSEQRYRSLIEATGTGYVITDGKGCVLDANPEYIRMTGREDLSTLRGVSVLEWTIPEDRARYQQIMTACSGDEEVRHFQIALQSPDGRITDVEVNAGSVRLESEGCILALCSDVSMRKVMEARRTQAQKLEAIGQLAAGIAHEINTPTQFVSDNVRFLGESVQNLLAIIERQRDMLEQYRQGRGVHVVAEPADERENLNFLISESPMAVQQAIEGITRVRNIVSAMKEFSHPGTKEMTLVDLNLTLEKALTVSRNEWQYCCNLETNYDANLPLIPCFADEINQVFLNIIVNAAHAVEETVNDDEWKKGTLRIETHHRDPWVEVFIRDTGPGIPEAIQDQIFHPFFTTKDVGKGTGQGLSLAKSAVEKHGGEISFQSEQGAGTTFTIRLPVTQANLSGDPYFGHIA